MPCACDAIGRDLVIAVAITAHAYTCAFDPDRHTRDEIVCYDRSDKPRAFDETRYRLSLGLVDHLRALPEAKVIQTPHQRNYVYSVPIDIEDQKYHIYFQIVRKREGGTDLALIVESAYPASPTVQVPRRPNNIRFRVLASKIFRGLPVRFAPR